MARAKLPVTRTAPPPQRPKRRRFGIGKWLFAILILLLIAVWFAPAIVLNTPLRNSLLGRALAGFPGKVSFSSASAGWLSPIVVNKINVADAEGQVVATVESAKTEKNLFSLLLEPQRLGTIRLLQPHVNVVVRDNGNNIEDLLRPWLASSKSSQPVACSVEVVDGTVVVTHVSNQSKWTFDKLQSRVAIPNNSAPFTAKLSADISGNQQPPGKLECDVQWSLSGPNPTSTATAPPKPVATLAPGAPSSPPPSQPATPTTNSISLRTTGLPLEALNPVLRQFGLNLQFSGRLTTDLAVSQTETTQMATVKSLVAEKLFVAAPSYLGDDQVQLAMLTGAGEVTRTNGTCQIRGATFKSDVGNLEFNGSVSMGDEAISASQLFAALRATRGELRGDIDIARLAAVLPHTLRIREGTHISGGQLHLEVTSQPQNAGHQWIANLEASNIAAMHEGNAIQWKQPIVVKSVVSENGSGISIDQLTCDSSFLQLNGQGNWDKGQLTANGDLDQFVREVGQFIDLGTLNAAGRVDARLAWKHDSPQIVSVTGEVKANEFQMTSQSMRPWQEQQLQIDFSASAKATERSITSLEQGDIEIKAAGDSLFVELRQAVPTPSATSNWPIHFKLQGDLGQWLARSQLFFAMPGWVIDGDNTEVKGDVNVSPTRVELATTEGTVKNLQVFGGGLFVREPTLQFSTTAAYDSAQHEFTASQTTISGTTVALRADDVRFVHHADNQVSIDGNVQYRTDLARLMAWMHDPKQTMPFKLAGAATGGLRMSHDGKVSKAELTADIDQFSYATIANELRAKSPVTAVTAVAQPARWQEIWQEPRLQISLLGAYDAQADRMEITKLEAAGEALSIGGVGSIREPLTRCDVELSGQYAYDLQRLSERLRGYLGPNVQMAGADAKPFTIRGPLFAANAGAKAPPTLPGSASVVETSISSKSGPASNSRFYELVAEADVAWKNISYQGFEIGEGELRTRLDKGVLNIEPLELPIGKGKVRFAPQVDLNETPARVRIEPGTVVDQVQISPEICRTWLKYVAPLVADATAAQGQLSVSLEHATFPADDPANGDIQGQLIVHSAQIGPGPLAQELLTAVQQVRMILERRSPVADLQGNSRWLEVPEQKTSFSVADRRVYHRDLQFNVRDTIILTSGSVGLDQSLIMLAEVPIRDEWLAKDRYLAALKGQKIKLPISGTLMRPQVDRRALTELTKQAAMEATNNVLQNQIERGQQQLNRGIERGFERGLEKFFPKAPQELPQQPPGQPLPPQQP